MFMIPTTAKQQRVQEWTDMYNVHVYIGKCLAHGHNHNITFVW